MKYERLDDLNGNGANYRAISDDGDIHFISRTERPALSYQLGTWRPGPRDMWVHGTPISREEFERVKADAKAWLERL